MLPVFVHGACLAWAIGGCSVKAPSDLTPVSPRPGWSALGSSRARLPRHNKAALLEGEISQNWFFLTTRYSSYTSHRPFYLLTNSSSHILLSVTPPITYTSDQHHLLAHGLLYPSQKATGIINRVHYGHTAPPLICIDLILIHPLPVPITWAHCRQWSHFRHLFLACPFPLTATDLLCYRNLKPSFKGW